MRQYLIHLIIMFNKAIIGLLLALLAGGSRPWQGKPQHIPGRIQCELYDEGGDGVAW